MTELTMLQKIAIWALPIIFAITLHEVAHGWVANFLGDPTAKMQGRLSLNPLRHIDPIGTLLIPGIMIALGGFIFGWAKPVPIGYHNLRHPRRDKIMVAIAGPLANLLMALIWLGFLRWGLVLHDNKISLWLVYTAQAGLVINIILMLLNLLPIPPLDGSAVVEGLLKGKLLHYYQKVARFGLWIVLALAVTGILSLVLTPLYQSVISGLLNIASIT